MIFTPETYTDLQEIIAEFRLKHGTKADTVGIIAYDKQFISDPTMKDLLEQLVSLIKQRFVRFKIEGIKED